MHCGWLATQMRTAHAKPPRQGQLLVAARLARAAFAHKLRPPRHSSLSVKAHVEFVLLQQQAVKQALAEAQARRFRHLAGQAAEEQVRRCRTARCACLTARCCRYALRSGPT